MKKILAVVSNHGYWGVELTGPLVKLEEEMKDCAQVQQMVQFFHSSKRGVVKRTLDD